MAGLEAQPTRMIASANVSGCPTLLDQTWFLSRLFPNKNDSDGKDSSNKNRPHYGWCHCLAGIYLVPKAAAAAENSTTTTTTRAIAQTLSRMIQANAMLWQHIQQQTSHSTINFWPATMLLRLN
jgi:hypothetical protein